MAQGMIRNNRLVAPRGGFRDGKQKNQWEKSRQQKKFGTKEVRRQESWRKSRIRRREAGKRSGSKIKGKRRGGWGARRKNRAAP